jgi:quercetin dioxygenase-like cupin family protein
MSVGNITANATSASGNSRENLWFYQNLIIVLATGETTGGQYLLVELHAPPGDEVPVHVHAHEEEAFFVLEGQMTLWVGDEEPRVLNPGDYGIMPRNVAHCYRVTSSTPARVLAITSPAGFEGFVREVSSPAAEMRLPDPSPPPTPDRRLTLHPKQQFGALAAIARGRNSCLPHHSTLL